MALHAEHAGGATNAPGDGESSAPGGGESNAPARDAAAPAGGATNAPGGASRVAPGAPAEDDPNALKVALATEHFLDGDSKVELARRHGMSRFQVARLLDEARGEGIVRIQIVDPSAVGHDHAPLAERLGIASVTVAAVRPGESMRAALARHAASRLPALLDEGSRLGIAWSRTLMHLPDSLDSLPRVDVIQLVGPVSTPGYSTAQSGALIHTLGHLAGGQVWALPAPLVVESARVAASLRAMDEVRSTLDAADALDVAVVAIGAWNEGASTLWARLTPDERRRAHEAGVVAEICGTLIDGAGALWHSATEDRVIGVRPDQLRRARVIAVAPAVGRPEAVIAAARSGMVDDLVLSPELADQVAARLE